MPSFVKKPVQIEAIQFDGTTAAMESIDALVGWGAVMSRSFHAGRGTCDAMSVRTPHGTVHLNDGDWVTKDLRGDVDVYGPDEFTACFDEAGGKVRSENE